MIHALESKPLPLRRRQKFATGFLSTIMCALIAILSKACPAQSTPRRRHRAHQTSRSSKCSAPASKGHPRKQAARRPHASSRPPDDRRYASTPQSPPPTRLVPRETLATGLAKPSTCTSPTAPVHPSPSHYTPAPRLTKCRIVPLKNKRIRRMGVWIRIIVHLCPSRSPAHMLSWLALLLDVMPPVSHESRNPLSLGSQMA